MNEVHNGCTSPMWTCHHLFIINQSASVFHTNWINFHFWKFLAYACLAYHCQRSSMLYACIVYNIDICSTVGLAVQQSKQLLLKWTICLTGQHKGSLTGVIRKEKATQATADVGILSKGRKELSSSGNICRVKSQSIFLVVTLSNEGVGGRKLETRGGETKAGKW